MENLTEILREHIQNMKSNSLKQTNDRNIHGKYNLSEEELERNRSRIISIEEKQEICKKCNGTLLGKCLGYIPVVQVFNGQFSEAVQACKYKRQREKQSAINKILALAYIPALYQGLTFDNYIVTADNEKAVKYAKWLVNEEKQGAYIYGTCGTGKTMLVSIIANEKAKLGQTVLFSSVPDLLTDIRQSFGNNTTEKVLETIRKVPCLILDDLGAERLTEWVSEQLFSIINYRCSQQLQTIITANYTPIDIVRRLSVTDKQGRLVDDIQGKRIVSRIFGMCARIELNGKDYRTA